MEVSQTVSDSVSPDAVSEGMVLNNFDALRVEIAIVIDDRARHRAEAERFRSLAEGAAQRADDLSRRLNEECSAHGALKEAAASTEAALRSQLERTQSSLAQTRAEAERERERAARDREREERFRRDLQELHILYRARRFDSDNVYERIAQVSTELVGAEKAVYLKAYDGFAVVGSYAFDDLNERLPFLQAIAKRVAEEHNALVVNDSAEMHAFGDADPDGIRDLAAYPIVIHDQLAGVVIVVNKGDGGFDDTDERLLLGIGSHAAVAIENRSLQRDIEDAYAATVALLCNVIEAKDPYTRGHCEEVASLIVAVARELGLSVSDQELAFQAGLLHDVGKIAVSDGILLKPGQLLPAEREVIEMHSTIGADIVGSVPSLRSIAPLILHHHERYDGTGYPLKLKATDILLLSRIICSVDAWCAMCSERPYRGALEPAAVRIEMQRMSGTQFDPAVCEALLRVIDDPSRVQKAWLDFVDESSERILH